MKEDLVKKVHAREILDSRGNPTVEVEYTFKITLPEGSAPGIWSIYEISLNDFALNTTVYDFTEIIHFDVNA